MKRTSTDQQALPFAVPGVAPLTPAGRSGGLMGDSRAHARLRASLARLGGTDVRVQACAGAAVEAVTVRFRLAGVEVERCQRWCRTFDDNLLAASQWASNRALSVQRGTETIAEAFADVAPPDAWPAAARERAPLAVGSQRTIEACVEAFRVDFERVGVLDKDLERDVRVRWDRLANWSTLRLRLPGGVLIGKGLQGAAIMPPGDLHRLESLTGLWLWFRGRVAGWERGVEDRELANVFRGYVESSTTKVSA